MRYTGKEITETERPASGANGDRWLTRFITTVILFVAVQVFAVVVMWNVVGCFTQYMGQGQECTVLFNHYAYQTMPGLLWCFASIASFVAFIIALVMYLLRSRH